MKTYEERNIYEQKLSKKRKMEYSNLSEVERKNHNKRAYSRRKERIANMDSIELKKHKEKQAAYRKNSDYQNKKYATDIDFKIKSNLRSRLYNALKNSLKAGSAVKDLGCTIEELRAHLESQWQEGMNWDNHTTKGWHIDHILPLSKFDLTSPEEFKKACHYSNLHPLWAKDNWSKGNRI